MRPILLNSCARAATAAEAKFRIDAPIPPPRGVRVVALDPAAVAVVTQLAARPWASARFFATAGSGRLRPIRTDGNGGDVALENTLDGADVTVMVATGTAGGESAAVVGAACAARGIMTAGLVLGQGRPGPQPVVAMLRPYARVILATDDDADLAEVLTALRA